MTAPIGIDQRFLAIYADCLIEQNAIFCHQSLMCGA